MTYSRIAMIFMTLHFASLQSGYSAAAQAGATRNLRELTYEECRKYIGKDGFRSKEELLQVFYNAYFSGTIRDIRVNEKEIGKMADAIRTMFPLRHCIAIESFDSILVLKFDAPQRVTVPGSFGMASLRMAEEVAFVLGQDVQQPGFLKFTIDQGYVRLHLAGVVKLLSRMKDMDGTELFYQADVKSKTSVIGLVEDRNIPRSMMKITGSQSRIVLDIADPSYKDNEDIVVAKDEMTFLSLHFKLKGNDSIMVNDGKWIGNPAANAGFRKFIDQTMDEFARGRPLSDGINIATTAFYQLERHKMSVSTGFHPPKKKTPNLRE